MLLNVGNNIAVNTGILKDLYSDKTPEGVKSLRKYTRITKRFKDFVEQERTPQEEELKKLQCYRRP
jgi:hypothetical protein